MSKRPRGEHDDRPSTIYQIIDNTLKYKCAARCMDSSEDRAATIEQLLAALEGPVKEWVSEAVHCAASCQLTVEECNEYATRFARQILRERLA